MLTSSFNILLNVCMYICHVCTIFLAAMRLMQWWSHTRNFHGSCKYHISNEKDKSSVIYFVLPRQCAATRPHGPLCTCPITLWTHCTHLAATSIHWSIPLLSNKNLVFIISWCGNFKGYRACPHQYLRRGWINGWWLRQFLSCQRVGYRSGGVGSGPVSCHFFIPFSSLTMCSSLPCTCLSVHPPIKWASSDSH